MPAVSKSQQRLFGQAYAYKTGELKKSDINPVYFKRIKKLANSMSEEELGKYAKTKHKKLPETVESMLINFDTFINENFSSDINVDEIMNNKPVCDVYTTNASLGYAKYAHLIKLGKGENGYKYLIIDTNCKNEEYIIGDICDLEDFYVEKIEYDLSQSPLYRTFLFKFFLNRL
jgi:hypothetical protein